MISPSEQIIARLNNARQIVKDTFSFIYLMSERQTDMQKYNLGNGVFVSAISLLATVNLLAKIHYILVNGSDAYVKEDQQFAYKMIVDKIKESNDLEWSEVRPYMHKPRLGDMNETNAFVCFIKSCPIDFGIDKENNKEIQEVWRSFRNKLTHIISLAGDIESGQMLMGLVIHPSEPGMYPTNIDFIRKQIGTYKPFDIPSPKTKATFKGRTDLGAEVLQCIIKDQCHVERLSVAVDMAIGWMITELRNNKYSTDNCDAVNAWLDQEMCP